MLREEPGPNPEVRAERASSKPESPSGVPCRVSSSLPLCLSLGFSICYSLLCPNESPHAPLALTSSLPGCVWSLQEKVVYVKLLCNRFLLRHLPSFPNKSPTACLANPLNKEEGLETQQIFGEPSGERMSFLKDVTA